MPPEKCINEFPPKKKVFGFQAICRILYQSNFVSCSRY